MKRLCYMILVLLSCILVISICCAEGQIEQRLFVGGTIYFGQYEQDNQTWNGTEPIEWIVMNIQED